MKDILKIIKSFEHSGLLLEGVTETIKNEAEEQKRRISIKHIRGKSIKS